MNILQRLWRDRTAATAIEYALIAALISVGCIVALQQLGSTTSGTFSLVGQNIAQANSSA